MSVLDKIIRVKYYQYQIMLFINVYLIRPRLLPVTANYVDTINKHYTSIG
jgi:hypothetical protein